MATARSRKKNLVPLRAADANRPDRAGFRGPETGGFDVAVRVRESSVAAVALEGVEDGSLRHWSAVLVWDETGVRTGKRTGLWATRGTLTSAFVLPPKLRTRAVLALTSSVVDVLRHYVSPRDLSVVGAKIFCRAKWIGWIELARTKGAVIASLALHVRPDLSKAKGAAKEEQSGIADVALRKLPTDWQIFGAISARFLERLEAG